MHEKLEAMNDACVLETLLVNLPSLLWKVPQDGSQDLISNPYFEASWDEISYLFPTCMAFEYSALPVADESAVILSEILFFYLTRL